MRTWPHGSAETAKRWPSTSRVAGLRSSRSAPTKAPEGGDGGVGPGPASPCSPQEGWAVALCPPRGAAYD